MVGVGIQGQQGEERPAERIGGTGYRMRRIRRQVVILHIAVEDPGYSQVMVCEAVEVKLVALGLEQGAGSRRGVRLDRDALIGRDRGADASMDSRGVDRVYRATQYRVADQPIPLD